MTAASVRDTRHVQVEQQQRDGWYCYECARWLPGGVGVVRIAPTKAYPGLYCPGGCRGGSYE